MRTLRPGTSGRAPDTGITDEVIVKGGPVGEPEWTISVGSTDSEPTAGVHCRVVVTRQWTYLELWGSTQ